MAELDRSGGVDKARSDSRMVALVSLDRARIRRERADGTLVVEGRRVILK